MLKTGVLWVSVVPDAGFPVQSGSIAIITMPLYGFVMGSDESYRKLYAHNYSWIKIRRKKKTTCCCGARVTGCRSYNVILYNRVMSESR